jgi:hypothetical protein
MDSHAAARRTHRIPRSTSVTIAIRPSIEAGRTDQNMISVKTKDIYFYPKGWTRGKSVKIAG